MFFERSPPGVFRKVPAGCFSKGPRRVFSDRSPPGPNPKRSPLYIPPVLVGLRECFHLSVAPALSLCSIFILWRARLIDEHRIDSTSHARVHDRTLTCTRAHSRRPRHSCLLPYCTQNLEWSRAIGVCSAPVSDARATGMAAAVIKLSQAYHPTDGSAASQRRLSSATRPGITVRTCM